MRNFRVCLVNLVMTLPAVYLIDVSLPSIRLPATILLKAIVPASGTPRVDSHLVVNHVLLRVRPRIRHQHGQLLPRERLHRPLRRNLLDWRWANSLRFDGRGASCKGILRLSATTEELAD